MMHKLLLATIPATVILIAAYKCWIINQEDETNSRRLVKTYDEETLDPEEIYEDWSAENSGQDNELEKEREPEETTTFLVGQVVCVTEGTQGVRGTSVEDHSDVALSEDAEPAPSTTTLDRKAPSTKRACPAPRRQMMAIACAKAAQRQFHSSKLGVGSPLITEANSIVVRKWMRDLLADDFPSLRNSDAGAILDLAMVLVHYPSEEARFAARHARTFTHAARLSHERQKNWLWYGFKFFNKTIDDTSHILLQKWSGAAPTWGAPPQQ